MKIHQIQIYLEWKSFSGPIFWKPFLPLNNQRTANKRLFFILTESENWKLADGNLYPFQFEKL